MLILLDRFLWYGCTWYSPLFQVHWPDIQTADVTNVVGSELLRICLLKTQLDHSVGIWTRYPDLNLLPVPKTNAPPVPKPRESINYLIFNESIQIIQEVSLKGLP